MGYSTRIHRRRELNVPDPWKKECLVPPSNIYSGGLTFSCLASTMEEVWAHANDEVKGCATSSHLVTVARWTPKEELLAARRCFVAQDFQAAAERCESYLLRLRPDLSPNEEKQAESKARVAMGAGATKHGERLAHWARSPRPSVTLTLASSAADASFCVILLQCGFELGRLEASHLHVEGRLGLVERFYANPAVNTVGTVKAHATLPFEVSAVWLRLRLHGEGNGNKQDALDDVRDVFARWFQGEEGRIFLDERLRVNELGRRDVLLATINRRSAVPLTPTSLRLRFRWALTLLLLDVLVPLKRQEEATKLLVRCTVAGKTSPLLSDAEAERIVDRIRVGIRSLAAVSDGRANGKLVEDAESAGDGDGKFRGEGEVEGDRTTEENSNGEEKHEEEEEEKGKDPVRLLGPANTRGEDDTDKGVVAQIQARIAPLVAVARR